MVIYIIIVRDFDTIFSDYIEKSRQKLSMLIDDPNNIVFWKSLWIQNVSVYKFTFRLKNRWDVVF